MRLYNQNGSHFGAKCRIVIYEKHAPVEIVPIPGGDLKSPEYLRLYPPGRTPALEVDGAVIGESEIINEYLEEVFAAPPLLPGNPLGRARARSFGRFVDLYLERLFYQLFPQVMTAARDERLIAATLAEILPRLDQLEAMMVATPFAAGTDLTLADCSMAPLMFYAQLTLQALNAAPFTAQRPKLAAWWTAVQQRPSVQRVHGEMMEAVLELQRNVQS